MGTAQSTGVSYRLPPPSRARLHAAQDDQPFELTTLIDEASKKQGTVLYLAYGSNLSVEKFQKARGVKPLAQINVQAPSLRLTFDLPGIPYAEPCFANSALQDNDDDALSNEQRVHGRDEEKASLLNGASRPSGHRSNKWHKGLVGVVYEVTQKDYAHIIATEGGGVHYKDIVVDCYPLASSDPSVPVPEHPTSSPFKAHTLFAPGLPYGSKPPKDGGRVLRPDPEYAQASARYLKLITDGAAELELPQDYQEYLHSLRPFTVTTNRQRLGKVFFLGLWGPILLSIFALMKLLADKRGRVPSWAGGWLSFVFDGVWLSYDSFFKSIFGEGEHTIGDTEHFSNAAPSHRSGSGIRRFSIVEPTIALEKLATMQGVSN